MRDILQTVAQCHCRGVIVRDVKPDNFLFLSADPNSPLRAIDFGLAEYCKRGETLTDKVRDSGREGLGPYTLNIKFIKSLRAIDFGLAEYCSRARP